MSHEISEGTIDGIAVIVLRAPGAGVEAAFAPGVGMVGCSLVHDGDELLGQRGGLAAYAERGSSFGIPLLHPWANRLDGLAYEQGTDTVELDPARTPLRLDEHGLPIHGLLAASSDWEVAHAAADADGAVLEARLDFGARPRLLAGFPFPHELRLTAELREAELTLRLALRPTGVAAVPLAFGFHPYLTLPGVPRADWQVEMPVLGRALLDERGIPTGVVEAPPFSGGRLGGIELDDLYTGLAQPAVFTLAGGGRTLSVEFLAGYPVAQVYSPADADFICFEPMAAPTNALVSGAGLRRIAPGAVFEAAFRIAIAAG